jgi:hypothetical protein
MEAVTPAGDGELDTDRVERARAAKQEILDAVVNALLNESLALVEADAFVEHLAEDLDLLVSGDMRDFSSLVEHHRLEYTPEMKELHR